MTDRELLELAARAAGIEINVKRQSERDAEGYSDVGLWTNTTTNWNPLADDGDRLRLLRTLGMGICFVDCTVWRRMPDGGLLHDYWGEGHGDEAHAVLRVAAAMWWRMR